MYQPKNVRAQIQKLAPNLSKMNCFKYVALKLILKFSYENTR